MDNNPIIDHFINYNGRIYKKEFVYIIRHKW